MLHHLVQYARDHALVAEPGFAPKAVRWAIILDATGRLLDVLPLGDVNSKKNPGRTFSPCPDMTQQEMIGGAGPNETRCHFLIETADVVAGYGVDQADARVAEKARRKHAFFLRLLRDAAQAMPELRTIAEALEQESTLAAIRTQLAKQKAKPTDKMTVEIDRAFPVMSDAWHDWWRAFRGTLGKADTKKDAQPMRCFISGALVTPTRGHGKIKGLSDVGGLGTGDALVSFDKDAFCSYGLEQSLNCAASEENMSAYVAALNEIIAKHSQRFVGMRVAHWFAEVIPDNDDPVFMLDDPTPRQHEASAQHAAAELLESIEHGEKTNLLHNRYYAMTLSGCSGRVMLRDWMEGSFEELVRNINQWFDDLAIVARDGAALAPPPKYFAVLGACVRDLKDLPDPLNSALYRAALTGMPIPRQAMAQALARVRIDIINDAPLNHTRMGVLKAYLIRTSRGESAMTPYLNPEHPSAAYHCGRLMAVLSRLQRRAMGDVGAGVVQRFYAAASATPALVLGRLMRTAQFHLNKLDKGICYYYEMKIAEISGRLGDAVPATLTLEEQSLFALGYYQQLALERAPKEQHPAQEENQ